MKLSTQWYAGLGSDSERQERKALVVGSMTTLKVLKKLLETRKKDLEDVMVSIDAYSLPSWPYWQADRIGAIRTLKETIALLTIEETND
jgi:hypothetical protein